MHIAVNVRSMYYSSNVTHELPYQAHFRLPHSMRYEGGKVAQTNIAEHTTSHTPTSLNQGRFFCNKQCECRCGHERKRRVYVITR